MLAAVLLAFAADTKPLEAFIAREVERHGIPALSAIVVSRDGDLWTSHHGKAKEGTVYRVGSVSKLFTAMGLARLAEQGKVDLDAKVDERGFTLRHLLAHRAGVVREPAVGSYFDETEPSLEKSVASFARDPLVYPVGTRTKYSNAGIALAGLLLGKAAGKEYAEHLREVILEPLGMKSSGFTPTPGIAAKLPPAVMWTYHGHSFAEPTFQMGIGPAGSLYSSVEDLGRFLRMLLNRGKLGGKRILGEKALEAMWKPAVAGEKAGFGIGFSIGDFEKRRGVGHNGAVYGFSTALLVLPDDGLGVAVASSKDCTNAVTSRLAAEAMKLFLADRAEMPAPAIEETTPLSAEEARRWAGRWESGKEAFDLEEQLGKLYHWPAAGGFRAEVRRLGKSLMTDDPLARGLRLTPEGDRLRVGKLLFARREAKPPPPCPAHYLPLLGEYGPGHLPTVILEKGGKLHLLVEWFFLYPLEEQKDGTFLPPDGFGLYHGERVAFTKDREGRVVSMSLGPLTFQRRRGHEGTFRIKPLRPVADLVKEAAKAKPPEERDVTFRASELIELTKLDATIKLDIRYATRDNFLGEPVYAEARAFLQKPAAEALVRAHRSLKKQGLGVMVFDGYRPWSVTKVFWEATPRDLRVFVADPAHGSRHNRGCAVDLTLYELKTGKPVEMPGGYDEMTSRSYPPWPGGTSQQRYYRDLLRRALEAEGFAVYHAEWWHFDHKDWPKYPIGNVPFRDIK
jgi:serine beta-lactamase-like protein LACTB